MLKKRSAQEDTVQAFATYCGCGCECTSKSTATTRTDQRNTTRDS